MVDVLAAVFILAIAALGWIRGLLPQVITFGAFVAIYVTFDSWYPPLDFQLAGLGEAFAAYPYLRRLVGFLVAYFAIVITVAVLELVILKDRPKMESAARIGGAGVGLLKGVIYAALLLWMVETAQLWERPPDKPVPSWLTESRAVALVGPYNPAKVYALKEAMEAGVARAAQARDGGGDDDSAEGERPRTGEPPRIEKPLEEDERVWAFFMKTPIRRLAEETATESEWQGRGYGDLVMDPKVREVLGDDEIAAFLLAEP